MTSSAGWPQIRLGTVRGRVLDPSGSVLPRAQIRLIDPLGGLERVAVSDDEGEFAFHKLSYGRYSLRVEADGFQARTRVLRAPSSLPVRLVVRLPVASLPEQLTVSARLPLTATDSPGTRTNLDRSLISRLPAGREIQGAVATVAGWATEDNGLLHARGVDDGFLFVLDGVPVRDRIDALFASPWGAATIQSMQVINGHLPAEYGNASGGIIQLVRDAVIGRPWQGRLGLGAGSFGTATVDSGVGGKLGRNLGLHLSQTLRNSTRRYLDPVAPGNFNNRGGALGLDLLLDWEPTAMDLIRAGVSRQGSDLRVPHTREQELAGQRQRQELRSDSQFLTWQRSWSSRTLTHLTWHRRFSRSDLLPGSSDTPLVVFHSRRHERQGLIFDITRAAGGHLLKAGVEGQRLSPREALVFFLGHRDQPADDAESGDEALNPALEPFTRDDPFRFRGSEVRGQASAYLQDGWQPAEKLHLEMGLRLDHSALLVSRSQLSPRVGAVYHLEPTGTAFRGSYNRLFMPPQVENLLLSSSLEARRLSPFAGQPGGGGFEIPPESQHAFETGFNQALGTSLRLDAAYWWRLVRNYADPNVFFGTTVLFPNSVARGLARGLDLRLDLVRHLGWSGYLSYSNSLVYQEGPINGGLFLEEEVIEIGPGTRFTPDHDQRNVGAFGVTYSHPPGGLWFSLQGRHESGTPLEVEEDALDDLGRRPGAELVDFKRRRVRSRTLLDLAVGVELLRKEGILVEARLEIRNLGNRRFAYNFGNPFSGTHFGHPRLWRGGLDFRFGP